MSLDEEKLNAGERPSPGAESDAQGVDAALSAQEALPQILHLATERSDAAQSRNNDAPFHHPNQTAAMFFALPR